MRVFNKYLLSYMVFNLFVINRLVYAEGLSAQTVSTQVPTAKEPCRLLKLGGTQPQELCNLREFLKEAKKRTDREPAQSVILYYGSAGTGKTTAAQEVANEASVPILFYVTSTLATDGISDEKLKGASAIKYVYQEAEKLSEGKYPVVIILDDIDGIARKDIPKMSTERQEALYELRYQLQKYVNHPRIITILTTNIYKQIDWSISQRCSLVILPVPTEENRLEIIKFHARDKKHHCTPGMFANLAKNYYEFTGRDVFKAFKRAREVADIDKCEFIENHHLVKGFEHAQFIIDSNKPSWTRRIGIFFGEFFGWKNNDD